MSIVELTREDFLIEEKNKLLQRQVQYEIDIKVLERTEPDVVVAKKQLTDKSWQAIKSKDMLEKNIKDLAGVKETLKAIEILRKP